MEIRQLALVGSSSSLHSEACNALGASDGVTHSSISHLAFLIWPRLRAAIPRYLLVASAVRVRMLIAFALKLRDSKPTWCRCIAAIPCTFCKRNWCRLDIRTRNFYSPHAHLFRGEVLIFFVFTTKIENSPIQNLLKTTLEHF